MEGVPNLALGQSPFASTHEERRIRGDALVLAAFPAVEFVELGPQSVWKDYFLWG
jgi:hypothetical protein